MQQLVPEDAIQTSTIWSESAELKAAIDKARRGLGDTGFDWYPYDSLTNLVHLKRLLATHEDQLFETARGEGVLDVGCADGELSFLFERAGWAVTAVDHPIPNHNGMRGIRMLSRQLGSKVSIHEIDIDSQFQLPQKHYGLAVFLGALYHLKNPYYVLERLAMHSSYCILSTRVARCLPDGKPFPPNQPLAYFLSADELNADDSNFWIFSHDALRRIMTRCRWEILEYFSVGDTARSTPTSIRNDERVFCLLRSHYGLSHIDLLHGWHAAEGTGWRWTKKEFGARIRMDGVAKTRRLVIRLFVPEALVDQLGTVTLSMTIGGVEVESAVLRNSGAQVISRLIDPGATEALVAFRLDKAIAAKDETDRELGVIVESLEIE